MGERDRYQVEDRGEKTGFGVVVDVTTGREVCEADACETPEDASVLRAFAPLLAECNALSDALTTERARAGAAEVEVARLRDLWHASHSKAEAAEMRVRGLETLRKSDTKVLAWTWRAFHPVFAALGLGEEASPEQAAKRAEEIATAKVEATGRAEAAERDATELRDRIKGEARIMETHNEELAAQGEELVAALQRVEEAEEMLREALPHIRRASKWDDWTELVAKIEKHLEGRR